MFVTPDRDTQTRIKHEILKEYLIKWGSIITNGLAGHYAGNPQFRSTAKVRFMYIDYFSAWGAYREDGDTVYGSPILGVRALDEIKRFFIAQTSGVIPAITTILFEEEAPHYDSLLHTLESLGYKDRVKQVDDLSRIGDGDIALINRDSSQYVDQVLNFIKAIDQTYSFHFIDPFGVKGVERASLEKIVSKERADCMINMMLNYISRWISVATKEDLTSAEQFHATALDEFYGSAIWRDIAHDLASGFIDRQEAETLLVNELSKILHNAHNSLTVKQIPLKFQDREQTLYYLFLTTRDPTGAFAINEILADAHIREYDYRVEKRHMKTKPGQTSFLELIPDPKRPTEPEPDIDLLADQTYQACQKREMIYRDVLAEMAHTGFFPKDMKDAMGKLRQQKRAFFDGAPSKIANRTKIRFA